MKGLKRTQWASENEDREIIQIGVIKVEALQEVDVFQVLVKPFKNPTLSGYIQHLTEISQAAVDENGLEFKDAYKKFREFQSELPTYSYESDPVLFSRNHFFMQPVRTSIHNSFLM